MQGRENTCRETTNRFSGSDEGRAIGTNAEIVLGLQEEKTTGAAQRYRHEWRWRLRGQVCNRKLGKGG